MSEKPIQDILYCRIATNSRRRCGSKSNKNKNLSNEKVNISSSLCRNKKLKHNLNEQQVVKRKRSKINIDNNVNRTKAHTSSDVRKKCPTITINILHNKSNTINSNNNSNSSSSKVNKGRGKSHNVLSRSQNMVDVVVDKDNLSYHCQETCNGSSLVISKKKQCSPNKYYNCSYYFNRLVINPMSFIHHRPPTVCVTLF